MMTATSSGHRRGNDGRTRIARRRSGSLRSDAEPARHAQRTEPETVHRIARAHRRAREADRHHRLRHSVRQRPLVFRRQRPEGDSERRGRTEPALPGGNARSDRASAATGDRRGAGSLLYGFARTRARVRLHRRGRERTVRRYTREVGDVADVGHEPTFAAARRSRPREGADVQRPHGVGTGSADHRSRCEPVCPMPN